MATLLPEGKQSFNKPDGTPLVGGKLYTYAAGTSTPKATYADASASVANTNPVILDARGEATIFWSGSYKVILKDADDSEIWSVDGVEDPLGNIYSPSGMSLLGFIQDKPAAVLRSALSKAREIYSFSDLVPAADGVTNDSGKWNTFKTWVAGRKLVRAGSYLINGSVKTYPNDVIEDDIQLFPPGLVGTENRAVERSFRNDMAALRVGGSDTASTNDERNHWRGLPSQNAWGNALSIGLFSAAFNRNGASYGTYSTTFGHDCVTYGVASAAFGAGSCTGDPDAPTSPSFEGYCSLAFGKNTLALGSKSVALNEETMAKGRAAFASGYASKAEPWNLGDEGLGATAMGRQAEAYGSGSVAFGSYLKAYNGAALLGSGINPGSPMTKTSAGVGIGANVVAPTLEAAPGAGTTTDFGYLIMRGGRQDFGVEHLGLSAPLAQTKQTVTNTGSGGYGEFQINPLVGGAVSQGWTFDAGRVGAHSLYPLMDGTHRFGAASYRIADSYFVNAPIVTSDIRQKQQIRSLTAAEQAVAVRLKTLVKAFKWNDAVAAKGSAARIHVGVIAQDVQAAFVAEGLDPANYAVFCYDEWPAQAEIRGSEGELVVEARAAGNRYGVRYEQLLAFIIAAL